MQHISFLRWLSSLLRSPNFSSPLVFILRSSKTPSTEEKYESIDGKSASIGSLSFSATVPSYQMLSETGDHHGRPGPPYSAPGGSMCLHLRELFHRGAIRGAGAATGLWGVPLMGDQKGEGRFSVELRPPPVVACRCMGPRHAGMMLVCCLSHVGIYH